MATYDFTNSWDNETFSVDGVSYNFSQIDYYNATQDEDELYGQNQTQLDSFGSFYTGNHDILNYGDFDLDNDDLGDWDNLNQIVQDNVVGGTAVAIDAEGEGFIQVTSNFNGYNSFGGEESDYGVLFDIWHIDGLENYDYVTAQITDGTLSDAYLSIYGEVDAYQAESGWSNQVSWPYLQHDLLTVDTGNMFSEDGAVTYGAYDYTMTIVTDWNDVSNSGYKDLDWGSMSFYTENQDGCDDWYDDLDWGKVQYKEYSNASFQDTEWDMVDGSELDKGDLKYLTNKDKKIAKINSCDLDINVLSKVKKNLTVKGNNDADIFVQTSKSLKKQKGSIDCIGGGGTDTFALQKSKKSFLEIKDFDEDEDYINTSMVKGSIKLKKGKKGSCKIYAGKDLLAQVDDAWGDIKYSKKKGIYSV